MHCTAWVRTDISPAATPAGYGPASLRSAYNLAAASLANGGAQTVAVVDAFDDPNAEADLSVYRSTFALPPCTTANGCFLRVNQLGIAGSYPPTDPSGMWEQEEVLDLDMVSAICPNCEIVLVEANSTFNSDFYAAVDTAATTCAATVVSNSWDGGEYGPPMPETADEVHFNHPGVMIVFASGDFGYNSSQDGYPVSSQYVTAVGGTKLCTAPLPSSCGGVTSETVWSQTGSRCSLYITQPAWQTALGSAYTTVCSTRISNDVAAVADPATPVAFYDTFHAFGGWGNAGGTSVATPIIASAYALAGNGASLTGASYAYSHASSLNDITSGKNGACPTYLCNAQAGFDGPTGYGTPNGIGAF